MVILSQTPVIRRLVKDGLITEASKLPIRLTLIPHSKTQKYIHAKSYLRRTGQRWDLFTGSMNLTPFAMTRNLEFMVRRVNPRGICSLEDYLMSFLSGYLQEKTIRDWLSSDDDCCTKTDIHDYDASIDADILSEVILQMPGSDPLCRNFLSAFVDRQACLENGVLRSDAPAVLTGSPLCGFFENIYLRETDIMLAEKSVFYARYADDILIAASTEEELEGLIHTLTQELEKKKLKINKSKTLRIAPNSSFTYLGWSINGNQVDFSHEMLTVLRTSIRSETKRLLIACRKNRLPEEMRLFLVISRSNRLIDHWRLAEAFRIVSVHNGLQEIDRMLYDMIRIVASGKTGSGRYRIRRERIREWGYRSLVNRYYRFIREASGS